MWEFVGLLYLDFYTKQLQFLLSGMYLGKFSTIREVDCHKWWQRWISLSLSKIILPAICSLRIRSSGLPPLFLQLQALPSSGKCILPINVCSEEQQWISGHGGDLHFITGKIFSGLTYCLCVKTHIVVFNKHPLSLQIFHDSWSLWIIEEI